jgi:CheY-like chemotaxis protein
MSEMQIPLCYYPTKAVLVDDNKKFLQRFSRNLNQSGIHNITFTDPEQALLYLEGISSKNTVDGLCYFKQEDDVIIDSSVQLNVNLKSLYQQIYNPERFNEISVLIVDYSMPQMTGDMLLNAFSNHDIKRILLTGQDEHKLAIQLLNKKIINNFSEKTPLDTDAIVVEQVHKLQTEYFNDFSDKIKAYCFAKSSYVFGSDYIRLVNDIIKKHSIVEHYTFSISGSKLLLDANTNPFFLVIANEEEMNGYYDTAIYSECSEDIINKLATKEFMPFLFDESEMGLEPSQWSKYLIPVKRKVLNDQCVWYGVYQGNNVKQKNTILSYNSFLNQGEK